MVVVERFTKMLDYSHTLILFWQKPKIRSLSKKSQRAMASQRRYYWTAVLVYLKTLYYFQKALILNPVCPRTIILGHRGIQRYLTWSCKNTYDSIFSTINIIGCHGWELPSSCTKQCTLPPSLKTFSPISVTSQKWCWLLSPTKRPHQTFCLLL